VLARDAHCSLHQLHERTALPKSNIRRLLGTLKKHHFVRQGTSDALYRANVVLPCAAKGSPKFSIAPWRCFGSGSTIPENG
jgi:hypothetical protein